MPGFRCPSASHSSAQAIGSPSLNPSHSKHRGFVYTGLVFLSSAHHIGGTVWKSTEQSRACLSPPANTKPVLAPSRQPLHQQLVSSPWRLKTAKDPLISKKEFKQSWDYITSWKRAYWKRREKKKDPINYMCDKTKAAQKSNWHLGTKDLFIPSSAKLLDLQLL